MLAFVSLDRPPTRSNNAATVSVFLTLKSPAFPALTGLTAGRLKVLEAMTPTHCNHLNSNTPGSFKENLHLELEHGEPHYLQEDNG